MRYEIEETRVGQKTNYDKLTLEIWTNGSIGPEMALVESAKILRKHLNPFVQYSELGLAVHADGARQRRHGHRRGDRAEAEHEPGRAEALGAGDQLPGIGKHPHGPRPGARATKTNCSKSATSARRRSAKCSEKLTELGLRLGMRVPAAAERCRSAMTAVNGVRRLANPIRSMRHRRKGRMLGRSPSHQRALLRNLASACSSPSATPRLDDNKPKVKGRIITTIAKGQGSAAAGRAVHHDRPPRLAAGRRRRRRIRHRPPSATAKPGRRGARATEWQQVEPGDRAGR